jgi:hypothetical protein
MLLQLLGVWLKSQYGAILHEIIEPNANQLFQQYVMFLTQYLRAINYKNLVPCVNTFKNLRIHHI